MGKTAVAQKSKTQSNTPSKINSDIRLPAGQIEVKNFPTLDLGFQPEIALVN